MQGISPKMKKSIRMWQFALFYIFSHETNVSPIRSMLSTIRSRFCRQCVRGLRC